MLLVLLAGAVAVLLARVMRRSAPPPTAARTDVPSVPAETRAPDPLPIEQYDELRAVDIAASIKTLDDPAEVQRVLEYEEAHNKRVTVFKAAKARLRALEQQKTVEV